MAQARQGCGSGEALGQDPGRILLLKEPPKRLERGAPGSLTRVLPGSLWTTPE
jgi:hypothetical protein